MASADTVLRGHSTLSSIAFLHQPVSALHERHLQGGPLIRKLSSIACFIS